MEETRDAMREAQARIHYEEGMYWLDIPTIPGLFASGETPEELHDALVEALGLYWSDDPNAAEVESWNAEALKALRELRENPAHELELALA